MKSQGGGGGAGGGGGTLNSVVSKKNNPLPYLFDDELEKSFPRDHHLSSLFKPHDVKWLFSEQIFLHFPSHSVTHDRFLCFLFLFDLILYFPPTIFQLCRDGSSWVEPVLS